PDAGRPTAWDGDGVRAAGDTMHARPYLHSNRRPARNRDVALLRLYHFEPQRIDLALAAAALLPDNTNGCLTGPAFVEQALQLCTDGRLVPVGGAGGCAADDEGELTAWR